jgi:phosphoribosylformylglycinamidine cyclo-ligase
VLYRDAGVDIDAMDRVKHSIARLARATRTPGVLSEIGLFGSLFKPPRSGGDILVASCDGVGTKLAVARMMDRYDTVGVDIVNHSVNDILTLGARPLFFLDYIAHADLAPGRLVAIVRGLSRACRAAGCALVGGETAMMPGTYASGDFDLVGFIVGQVERKHIVDARRLSPGDVAIGLPSSGLHTNGYSLARRVLLETARLGLGSRPRGLGRTLGEALLAPHRSYLKPVWPLLPRLKAIAHITGGGFYDNIERLLPAETACIIHRRAWHPPALFRLIQRLGSVPDEEMYRTFNMGIGMVLFAAPARARRLLDRLPGSRLIGRIVRGTFGTAVV